MAPAALRDAGLRRVRATTRMLAVGSLTVAGVLSLLVARAHPGTSTHPHAVPTVPTSPASQTSPIAGTPPASRPSLGRTSAPTTSAGAPGPAPAPAPTATTQPPVTSSGAS